jgi:hypothetical protein
MSWKDERPLTAGRKASRLDASNEPFASVLPSPPFRPLSTTPTALPESWVHISIDWDGKIKAGAAHSLVGAVAAQAHKRQV